MKQTKYLIRDIYDAECCTGAAVIGFFFWLEYKVTCGAGHPLASPSFIQLKPRVGGGGRSLIIRPIKLPPPTRKLCPFWLMDSKNVGFFDDGQGAHAVHEPPAARNQSSGGVTGEAGNVRRLAPRHQMSLRAGR